MLCCKRNHESILNSPCPSVTSLPVPATPSRRCPSTASPAPRSPPEAWACCTSLPRCCPLPPLLPLPPFQQSTYLPLFCPSPNLPLRPNRLTCTALASCSLGSLYKLTQVLALKVDLRPLLVLSSSALARYQLE